MNSGPAGEVLPTTARGRTVYLSEKQQWAQGDPGVTPKVTETILGWFTGCKNGPLEGRWCWLHLCGASVSAVRMDLLLTRRLSSEVSCSKFQNSLWGTGWVTAHLHVLWSQQDARISKEQAGPRWLSSRVRAVSSQCAALRWALGAQEGTLGSSVLCELGDSSCADSSSYLLKANLLHRF